MQNLARGFDSRRRLQQASRERSAIFPFWEIVIAPLLRAAAPTCVVEIGALRGDTTVSLLESLGSDTRLHVIDPVPQFDPAEHERRFRGQYVFHRDVSLRVLPTLEPVDVALIDGDHNWYTVYNELKALRSQAQATDRPAPVFVLHDVAWPYGRRDGYYAPEQIPDEFRQPNAQLGLERGNPGLCAQGGLNAHVWNAEHEGGQRNGVRTALEDFLDRHGSEFRSVVLEFHTGLAVVAPIARLARRPELALLLDRMETADGQQQIREQTEAIAREAFASGKHHLG